jgi:branched-chain amino acid transport system substrate-binding protein
MRSAKWVFLISVAALLVLAGMPNGLARAQETIKIGGTMALTGPGATYGVGVMRSASIAVDEINAKGGINGKKLEFICLDSEHQPVKTIANARKLVEKDKVVAMLGCSNSASNIALAPIINNELKVPVLVITDAMEIIENEAAQKGLPNYMFRFQMYGTGQTKAMFHFARENFGYKNIALLTWTGGWGLTGRTGLRQRLAEAKIQAVADETYDAADTDMTPQILKIQGAKANVILNYGIVKENVLVLRAKDKLGDKTPQITTHALASQSFWAAAEGLAEGIMCTTWVTVDGPRTPKLEKFLVEYNRRYGPNLESVTGTLAAYDEIYLLAQAIAKAGPNPKGIRDALENIPTYSGLTREFKRPVYTKDRHEAFIWDQDFFLCRWTSGKLLKVEFDGKGPYVNVAPDKKRYINKETGALE